MNSYTFSKPLAGLVILLILPTFMFFSQKHLAGASVCLVFIATIIASQVMKSEDLLMILMVNAVITLICLGMAVAEYPKEPTLWQFISLGIVMGVEAQIMFLSNRDWRRSRDSEE